MPQSIIEARVVFLVEDRASRRYFLGEHGLSVLVEAVAGDGRVYRVLFDVGQHADTVIHNARLLGVDLSSVDVIVLSHNHYDHTGGLIKVLQSIGRRTPVIAHPDIFKPSIYIGSERVELDIGPGWSKSKAEEAGAYFILTRSPMEVAPGVYYLGEVVREREDLAPGLPGAYTIEDGELVPHKLRDDTGLAISIEGYGLVVLSGCGHSGITNITLHASRTLKENVKAVMGGFHLHSARLEVIREVTGMLREMSVEEVHAGHCTGLRAESMLLEAYKDKFHQVSAGYTAVFKALKS
ncbi:MAG: MBL fold metallo-hydrolase [Desulfurococcus sp.]|nr:MBL fold metallo-hydrolase [Desulfurococcus sp.]